MTGQQPISRRLTIKEGMTVNYVKQHGNAAQKVAICIFDKDGNGIFSKREADEFNSTRLTLQGDELRINKAKYLKGHNPLIKTVNLKDSQKEYGMKQEAEVIRKKATGEFCSPCEDNYEVESYDKNGNLVRYLRYMKTPGLYKVESVNDYDNTGRKIKNITMVNNDVESYNIIRYSDSNQKKQTKIISYDNTGTLVSTEIREYDKNGHATKFETFDKNGKKTRTDIFKDNGHK